MILTYVLLSFYHYLRQIVFLTHHIVLFLQDQLCTILKVLLPHLRMNIYHQIYMVFTDTLEIMSLLQIRMQDQQKARKVQRKLAHQKYVSRVMAKNYLNFEPKNDTGKYGGSAA